MKQKLFFILWIFSGNLFANNIDSVLLQQQDEIIELQILVENIQNQRKLSERKIKRLESKITTIENKNVILLDSIAYLHSLFVNYMAISSNEINIVKSEQVTDKQNFDNLINDTRLYGLIVSVFLLLISLLVVSLLFVYKKRNFSSIEEVKKVQDSMLYASLELDKKLLAFFDKQLSVFDEFTKMNPNNEQDHSLVLKVVDEITRIEKNLACMDASTRGHKQLASSVRRIKENLFAYGYEIPELLGKKYNDGMKVVADFIIDENLKDGEQVITNIKKPQVNYKGLMIQAANIVVSQNT